MKHVYISVLAILPVVSVAVLWLEFERKGKIVAGYFLLLLLTGAALFCGIKSDSLVYGALYAAIFGGVAAFPAANRREVLTASSRFGARKAHLQDELSRHKAEFERWGTIHKDLTARMNMTARRYTFAKSLVSYLEEEPVLSDLGATFASEKSVLGIAFKKLANDDSSLPAESGPDMKDGPLAFYRGWFLESDWKKMLSAAPVSFEAVKEYPIQASSGFMDSVSTNISRKEIGSLKLVTVPVKWNMKVQGLLAFVLSESGGQDFIDETTVYSQLLGLGMQKAQLYRLILERSRKDGLTDLYLRRIFMERLNEEISFSKRYGTSFSILMMDLDHFKNVNDSYGHPAGDAVLRSVAAALKSALHPGVMICRYGGEEFAAIIGLAPRDEVVAIAENVRRAVSEVQVPGPNGVSINVTVSVGVSHYLPDSPPVEEMVRRADAALYSAKEAGRNSIREWQ